MPPSKTKIPPRAYLLKGDDDYKKNIALEDLLKSLVNPDFADFDFEQIDPAAATCDRIISALNVPPFASDKRVVLIRFANQIKDDEQKLLSPKLAKVPESACLILVNPATEKVDGKAKKGSEVIGDLSKAIRSIGVVTEYGAGKKKELTPGAIDFIKKEFAKTNLKVDMPAVNLLTQRVGTDFSILNTEIQKIIAYCGSTEAKVTVDIISNITTETPEEKIFKLLDAAAEKKQGLAIKFLNELFLHTDDPKAEAPKMLSNISRLFRQIYQVKIIVSDGLRLSSINSLPDEIAAKLPRTGNIVDLLKRQSWQADKLARLANAFTYEELARCFELVEEADLSLKGLSSGPEEPELIMQLLIIKLSHGKG
jgi:DNA polymerase III subunit delta